YMAALRREQGRIGEMEAVLGGIVARWPNLRLTRCQLCLCYCDLGRKAEANLEFERIVADDFAQAPRDETWLVWMVMLAEICAYLADVRYAPRLYELLAPYAARNVVLELNACYGAVSRYLGLLATTMRRFDEANTQFTRALELNQRMGARPFVARTQCEYAAMLLLRDQAGDREKAAKLLEAAVATASALAMASLAEKARALLNKPVVGATAAGPEAAAAAPVDNIFRREGDFWTVAYDGEIFRLRDIKGLGYIAHLLGQPETEVHALELMASIAPPVPEDPGARAAGDVMGAMTEEQLGELGLRHGAPDDAGEMLDSEAKAAYKRRLDELSEELEDAEQFQDVERAEKIREEKDALAKELRRAVGLGGRDRRAASISERARINVTRAIKSAIERIAENNAGLGRMLAKTIKTGTFCSYVPDPREPIFWQL
ncbi:MAG TPA: hypothetical protein VEK14_01050, partial [Rhodomicrobium sp.]|nr:hypothetical protein [Rhodomicrobium sp.]